MKKRLRKKKHLDEYAGLGRQFVITETRKDGFDEFLDAFVTEAVEGNRCLCGGSGKEDRLDVIVELGNPRDDRDGRVRAVRTWLDGREDVACCHVGPEFDLWYGDCPELTPVDNDEVFTGEANG